MYSQIYNFINQGGSIAWVITALYFLVMTVTVERSIFFIRTSCSYSSVERMLLLAKCESAADALANERKITIKKNSQFVAILLHYLSIRNLSEKAFNESLERKAFVLIADMERHIWILSQVGHIAPLLGLLGTVIGLIEAFRIMATLGASADVASFASGIWVAMITTALGLIVAIPSIFLFKIFEKIVEKRSTRMSYVVSMLNEIFSRNPSSNLQSFNKTNTVTSDEDELHETF